jgi:hypothetical protein
MAAASDEARKATAVAISPGSIRRLIGETVFTVETSRSPRASAAFSAGVRVTPGETALTRTFDRPHSAAKVWVMAITAALAARHHPLAEIEAGQVRAALVHPDDVVPGGHWEIARFHRRFLQYAGAVYEIFDRSQFLLHLRRAGLECCVVADIAMKEPAAGFICHRLTRAAYIQHCHGRSARCELTCASLPNAARSAGNDGDAR